MMRILAFARDPWGDGVLIVFSASEDSPGPYYEGTDFYTVLDYDRAKELWYELDDGLAIGDVAHWIDEQTPWYAETYADPEDSNFFGIPAISRVPILVP